MAEQAETQQPVVQSTMSAAPKQLTSTDILSKMQAGIPIMEGEKLPDVPKGMSAKSFYGQFPGGAAVYSQAPFKQTTYGTYRPAKVVSEPVTQPEEEEVVSTPTPAPATVEEVQPDSDSPSLSDIESQLDDLPSVFDDQPPISPDLPSIPNDPLQPVVTEPSSPTVVSPTTTTISELSLNNILDLNVDINTELESLKSTLDPTEYTNAYNNLSVEVSQIASKMSKALDASLIEAADTAKSIGTKFTDFMESPFTNTVNIIGQEMKDLGNAIGNITDPNKYMQGLEYIGEKAAKGILSNVITGIATKLGAGSFGGPIGIGLTTFLSELDFADFQIGQQGVAYNNDDPHAGGARTTTIVGYDQYGIARDPFGNVVYGYLDATSGWNNLNVKGPTYIGSALDFFELSPEDQQTVRDGFRADFFETYRDLEEGAITTDYEKTFGPLDEMIFDDDPEDGDVDPTDTSKSDIDQQILDMLNQDVEWGSAEAQLQAALSKELADLAQDAKEEGRQLTKAELDAAFQKAVEGLGIDTSQSVLDAAEAMFGEGETASTLVGMEEVEFGIDTFSDINEDKYFDEIDNKLDALDETPDQLNVVPDQPEVEPEVQPDVEPVSPISPSPETDISTPPDTLEPPDATTTTTAPLTAADLMATPETGGAYAGIRGTNTSSKMEDFIGSSRTTNAGTPYEKTKITFTTEKLVTMSMNKTLYSTDFTFPDGKSLGSIALNELANRLGVPVEQLKGIPLDKLDKFLGVEKHKYPKTSNQALTLDDLIGADLDRDMPLDEDPTIDTPPEDYNPGGEDTPGGYDAGSDFGVDTTAAEQEAAMAEGDYGDDSDSDGSGGGSDDAGLGGEDM